MCIQRRRLCSSHCGCHSPPYGTTKLGKSPTALCAPPSTDAIGGNATMRFPIGDVLAGADVVQQVLKIPHGHFSTPHPTPDAFWGL